MRLTPSITRASPSPYSSSIAPIATRAASRASERGSLSIRSSAASARFTRSCTSRSSSIIVALPSQAERRRVMLLHDLAVAQIHVDAAGQARVEAAYRAHDVDALEVVAAVFLEDRRPLDRVLVRAGRAVDIARAGVPGRRRVGVVVGD